MFEEYTFVFDIDGTLCPIKKKEERYEVIENFKDSQDNEYLYLKNVKGKNIYPREGLKPSKKRIEELSSNKNQVGKPLIRKIEEVLVDSKKNQSKE